MRAIATARKKETAAQTACCTICHTFDVSDSKKRCTRTR